MSPLTQSQRVQVMSGAVRCGRHARIFAIAVTHVHAMAHEPHWGHHAGHWHRPVLEDS